MHLTFFKCQVLEHFEDENVSKISSSPAPPSRAENSEYKVRYQNNVPLPPKASTPSYVDAADGIRGLEIVLDHLGEP